MRTCTKCGFAFEPIAALKERLAAKGMQQRVCPRCVIEAIGDMAAESVFDMTDEEVEAELRADGFDVEALTERIRKLLADARAEREPEGGE